MIINLNTVLGSLGDQSEQFGKAVDSLSELVHGARRPQDRHRQRGWPTPTPPPAVDRRPAAPGRPADCKDRPRRPTASPASSLADHDYLDNLLKTLPDEYRALARQGMYGDYFSFYLCDIVLKLNGKGGQPVYIKVAGQSSGRCTPK